MTRPIQLSSEIQAAQDSNLPIVALESTVIAHGLPYPTNLDTARRMEAIVRENQAVPATIAVLQGQLRVGLSADELEHLARDPGIRKASRRDLPILVAEKGDGATTVAATATIAAWAGLEVFATGGIGGVHRDPPFDISNDLPTLAQVPVTVVCSGAKSILNLRATLEWLETAGVPIVGYGTDEFPAFYSRSSGHKVDIRADTPDQVASLVHAQRRLGLDGGLLVTVPVPAPAALSNEYLEASITTALQMAQKKGITGSATTPFLLDWIVGQTEGASLKANVALLENNAEVGAQVARAFQQLKTQGT
jgi:pseudouridine-5'-phosphate glycosidase